MPHYYFDSDDDRDAVGADLPDDGAARSYGLRLAGDLIRDLAAPGADALRWRLCISDAARRPLAALAFELQSD